MSDNQEKVYLKPSVGEYVTLKGDCYAFTDILEDRGFLPTLINHDSKGFPAGSVLKVLQVASSSLVPQYWKALLQSDDNRYVWVHDYEVVEKTPLVLPEVEKPVFTENQAETLAFCVMQLTKLETVFRLVDEIKEADSNLADLEQTRFNNIVDELEYFEKKYLALQNKLFQYKKSPFITKG